MGKGKYFMKHATMKEIRAKGIKTLTKELGSADTIRFLQELSDGYGDYTKERNTWLDNISIDDISKEIFNNKKR